MDDASAISTSEHIATVEIDGKDVTGLYFGFSPNIVTHTADGGQGTFRQFIQNANAISGPNEMRFIPMVKPNSGDWWTVELQNPLPVFTDAGTIVDGTAYYSDGTIRDENSGFSGHGGEAVGTGMDALEGSGDEATLPYFANPELEIDMNDHFNTALDAIGYVPAYDNNASGVFVIDADGITIRHIALKDAAYANDETTPDIYTAILIKSGTNVLVSENFIGCGADGSEPPAGEHLKNGILQLNASISAIMKNFVSYTLFTGIWAADNTFIYKNDLYKAASLPTGDAITTELSSGFQIRIENNRIEGASGYGIDSFNSPSVVTILENTLIANGQDATEANKNERGGIRIFGFDNVVSHNVIHDHPGNALVVTGGKAGNLLTQNAIYRNGGMAIDLDLGSSDYNGDGITPNDGQIDANTSNMGMDTPVFTSATYDGGILHLSGYVGSTANQSLFADATVEIFKVESDGESHGEGRWYLGSCLSDSDGNFDCNITTDLVAENDQVAATATDISNNTSEFGPNQIVTLSVPSVSECLATFPAALSSTADTIDIDTGVRVYNTTDNTLITQILTTGPDALCDGDGCLKSDTLAGKYSFTVDTGNGTDGAITRSGDRVDINESGEFSSIDGDSGATFTIRGDMTIKTQQEFSLASRSTLNIDGNVTIHADRFLMGTDCTINVESGSLTVYTNYASLNHSAANSLVERSEEFIIFSKGRIDIGTKGELRGLFYSEDLVYVKQGNTISGALTGKSIDVDPQAVITYDQPAVSRYCGDTGKPILSIADSQITEGNSGTKEIRFTISSDRILSGDVTIDCSTGDGSATTADSDYRGFKKLRVTLSGGSDSVTVSVPVEGDTRIEPDEDLFLYLSSRDDVIIADNYARGVIVNDDYHLKIIAADTAEINGTIGTKIVNHSFSLNLVAYDIDNNIPLKDLNITSIDLLTPSGTVVDWWSGPDVTTGSDGVARIDGLNSPMAIKDAGLLIHANLYGGTYEDNSSDHFAIRPDHFGFIIPAHNIAGAAVTFHAEAQDEYNAATPGYNATQGNSFRIGYREQQSGCNEGVLTFNGNNRFSNGLWDLNVTYSEIGKIDLNISEIPGFEFAAVDRVDTPDNMRYITPAVATGIMFVPARLKILSWDLVSSTPVTYYASAADLDRMGAKIKVRVQAQSEDGAAVRNYTASCYAETTDLNISFNILTVGMEEHKLIWKDLITPSHTSEATGSSIIFSGSRTGSFVYSVDPSHFVGGEANESIMLNFDRKANLPKEALRFEITQIAATNAIHTPSEGLVATKSENFYYGRLHAPDYTHVGDTFDAKIFYEVYSKRSNPDVFPLLHGRESMDTIHWHIVEHSVPGAICNAYGINANGSVRGWSDDTISLKAPKLPFIEKVRYQPEGYLRYNRWSDTVMMHSFKVNFSSSGTKWAGKGERGAVLDLNVSRRRGQTKMEW